MKKTIFVLLFMASVLSIYGQKRAVTETGEEVFLYDDGTWKYKENPIEEKEIHVNTKRFTKNKESSFLLKSNKVNVGIWLNPKKWSFNKAEGASESEYQFELKSGDLYGMLIAEKIEIPLETMRLIALENGREAAPDLHIVKEEYRKVNGLKVLLLQMNGTMQGVKFSYYGYYFSNSNGTLQFITYTAQNLLEEHKGTCEELLNGLVELKK